MTPKPAVKVVSSSLSMLCTTAVNMVEGQKAGVRFPTALTLGAVVGLPVDPVMGNQNLKSTGLGAQTVDPYSAPSVAHSPIYSGAAELPLTATAG